MAKLIVRNNALNSNVTLSQNGFGVSGDAQVIIELANLPNMVVKGLNDIEVQDNCNLTIPNSELPLNNINIIHGTINLNNNYEGEVPVAISVGENSKFTQTDKDLSISSVTIGAQSDFKFTHNGVNYNIHNSAPSLISQTSANGLNAASLPGTGAKIVIKNPHEKLNILKNLESTKLDDFKDCEEFINLLLENDNISDDITQIKSYISQNYLKLTGVQDSTAYSTIFPNEILTHICSYLDLDDVVQPALAGESSHTVSE